MEEYKQLARSDSTVSNVRMDMRIRKRFKSEIRFLSFYLRKLGFLTLCWMSFGVDFISFLCWNFQLRSFLTKTCGSHESLSISAAYISNSSLHGRSLYMENLCSGQFVTKVQFFEVFEISLKNCERATQEPTTLQHYGPSAGGTSWLVEVKFLVTLIQVRLLLGF